MIGWWLFLELRVKCLSGDSHSWKILTKHQELLNILIAITQGYHILTRTKKPTYSEDIEACWSCDRGIKRVRIRAARLKWRSEKKGLAYERRGLAYEIRAIAYEKGELAYERWVASLAII